MSRYPVTVLEGPDGVGKTTLAKALCRELGAKYLHLTYRWPSKMFDYHTAALFYVLRQAEHQPVVLDRWWMSEVTYASVYRGGSKWPLAYRLFEKAALLHGFTYVMCLPADRQRYVDSFEKLKTQRKEMYSSDMGKVYDEFKYIYNKMYAQGHPTLMRYDLQAIQDGKFTFNDEVTRIYREAFDNLPGMWLRNLPSDFMNVTGRVDTSEYVFVGDVLKPKTRREVWPFFEYGNSSLYLAEQFHELKVPEHQLMFINANYKHQTETHNLLLDLSFTGKKFVAMGRTADDTLHSLQIRHRTINHPQYYRRFHREDGLKDLQEIFYHGNTDEKQA